MVRSKVEIFKVDVFDVNLTVTASPYRYPLPVNGALPVTIRYAVAEAFRIYKNVTWIH